MIDNLLSVEECAALALVLDERERQNKLWGEQNHSDEIWLAILTEEVGETAEAILHTHFGGKRAGKTEEELTQAVAVGLQWLACIQRRKNGQVREEHDGTSQTIYCD